MFRRASVLVTACLCLVLAAACGPQPDIRKSLKLLPEISGYYDDGVQPDGQNRLLPSMTFRLKNEGDLPIDYVDLVMAYWPVGADGEKDSNQIVGIGRTSLEPGHTTEPLTVRSSVGYKGPMPRAEFFSSSIYTGFIVKIFAKRRGKTVPMGEFPIEARLLPSAKRDGANP